MKNTIQCSNCYSYNDNQNTECWNCGDTEYTTEKTAAEEDAAIAALDSFDDSATKNNTDEAKATGNRLTDTQAKCLDRLQRDGQWLHSGDYGFKASTLLALARKRTLDVELLGSFGRTARNEPSIRIRKS